MKLSLELKKRDIIELVLLIIILLLILVIVFKTLVLSSLIGKAKQHEDGANVYERIEFENSDKVKSYNMYKKGNIVKTIVYTKKNGRFIKYDQYQTSAYDTPTDETNDELAEYNKRSYNVTVNYFSADTIWEIMNSAMIVRLKSAKTSEGADCYVFDNIYDKQKLNDAGIEKAELYIDKSTGLPAQKVETKKDGSTNTIKFNYEFGNVTDRDVKIPTALKNN
jgi:hypothetical protein